MNVQLQKLALLRGDQLIDALFPDGDPDFVQIRNMATDVEGDANASQVLEHLRSEVTQPELPTDVDYVRVMSLHKSKGLTADLVVVMGCMEGLIPTLPLDNKVSQVEMDSALEEQRRLFYVAITRARKTLILSGVTGLDRDLAYKMGVKVQGRGGKARTIATRFIGELGPACPATVTGQDFLKFGMPHS